MKTGPRAAASRELRQVRKKAAVSGLLRATREYLVGAETADYVRGRDRRAVRDQSFPTAPRSLFPGRRPIASASSSQRTRRPPPRRRRARLGQNFLADGRVARRIVQAAGVDADDRILEIGPGRGALTGYLAERAERVVAVELDSELARALRAKLADRPNVAVIDGDALAFDPRPHFAEDRPYKIVANLPYYTATPIIRRYVAFVPRPDSLTVMVQREVAESIAAAPGRMTFLTVAVRLYADARILFAVPPRAFRPAPKVASAVVRIVPRAAPAAIPPDAADGFLDFAAAGFRAPRKRIRNSLRHGLNIPAADIDALLKSAGIDGARRPADLDMPEWIALHAAWRGR